MSLPRKGAALRHLAGLYLRRFGRPLGVERAALARFAARWPDTPPPPLDLALVVPVHDDAAGLARLLAQAAETGLFSEAVVVDDGSDPVLTLPDLPLPVTLLRHDAPRGGGAARNAGLAAVQSDYLLYVDADDALAPGLAPLLADLADEVAAGRVFDLCLFKHADSRVLMEPRWGQPDWDEIWWERAGHAAGALAPARPGALPLLAQTANYPWNKVYRTTFLRDNAILCAETEVHQDIPLHWLSLIAAAGGRALVSDRIGIRHEVAPAGTEAGRVTDRRGLVRLQVFQALDPVVPRAEAGGPDWQLALARFLPGLFDWIKARIGAEDLPRFRRAEADFLRARIAPWVAGLEAADPALARDLRHRMRAGE